MGTVIWPDWDWPPSRQQRQRDVQPEQRVDALQLSATEQALQWDVVLSR